MSIEYLLQPISAAQPCGVNLDYDAGFQALEQAAAGRREQQYGSVVIAPEPPDWMQVERLACGLLERTKDLRIIVSLCHAWTHLQGLDGYTSGLQLLQQTLTRYGQQVFPQRDAEGEFDPYLRINALAALGDQSALGRAVQAACLIRSASGEISLRDACALLERSKTECAGFPGGRSQLVDELSAVDRPAYQTTRALARAIADLRDTIARELGDESLPEMAQMIKCVGALTRIGEVSHATVAVPGRADTVTGPSGFESLSQSSQPAQSPRSLAGYTSDGVIASRDEAVLALSRVQEYFRQHEPGHPAPMMLERVQRTIAMDFLQILQDLAPESLGTVRAILGTGAGADDHKPANG